MALDYDSALPIRSEADGSDERVHVKIVDKTNPSTQQMTVDTDGNAHVELHGNDEATTDRVVATNEKGNIALDGDYDVTNNTNPSSVGIIAHDRDATHNRTKSNLRVTAVSGESNTICLDVSLHDETGQNYDANNPLPVTLEESKGDEIHEFDETETVTSNSTATHTYVVANNKTFLLYKVLCSGSGKIKVLLDIGDGALVEVFTTKAVTFNSTANPQADIEFNRVPIKVVGTVNTTIVKVLITNRDNQSQDVHSTIVGILKDTII